MDAFNRRWESVLPNEHPYARESITTVVKMVPLQDRLMETKSRSETPPSVPLHHRTSLKPGVVSFYLDDKFWSKSFKQVDLLRAHHTSPYSLTMST